MKAKKLSELRDALSIVINEKISGQGASSAEIADEFISRHQSLLDSHRKDVDRLTVMQLINEVSRRKPSRSVVPGQADLFGDYAGPQAVVVTAKGSAEKKRRSIYDLTIDEATAWIDDHKRTRQREARDAVEIDSLVERARPFCKGKMTIKEGLIAAVTAAKKA